LFVLSRDLKKQFFGTNVLLFVFSFLGNFAVGRWVGDGNFFSHDPLAGYPALHFRLVPFLLVLVLIRGPLSPNLIWAE